MKTMRWATAALAASVSFETAAAQEWSTEVGGFMILGAGYVDSDQHLAELEVVNDGEVIFGFRLNADNGLTFGAQVEFEANGTDENADEYVGFVSGSFGRLEIGREDGAGDRLLLTPPGCSLSCSGDGDGFLFDYAEDAAGDAINNGAGATRAEAGLFPTRSFQVTRTVTGLAVKTRRLATLTWIAASLHCAPKARACRRPSQLAFSLPTPVSRSARLP
jgi:hypothetical protein